MHRVAEPLFLLAARARSSYNKDIGSWTLLRCFGSQSDSASTSGSTAVLEANKELEDFFGVSTRQLMGGQLTPQQSPLPLPQLRDPHPPHHLPSTLSDAVPVPHGRLASLWSGQVEGWANGVAHGSSKASGSGSSGAPSSGGVGNRLTHVDASGAASMVDVSDKPSSVREAAASARVLLGSRTYELVAANMIHKGDVLAVARLAGITAAKQTATLIPLCHNIPISKVDVALALDPASHAVDVRTRVTCVGRTGVEMEALTAASVAALTVYDMCKAVSKAIVISHVRLEAKSGGKSGDYVRSSSSSSASSGSDTAASA